MLTILWAHNTWETVIISSIIYVIGSMEKGVRALGFVNQAGSALQSAKLAGLCR